MHKSILAAVALAAGFASNSAWAQTIGVSWSNFQEERWKTDEAAIKAELAKSGAKYIMSDAGASSEKQLADIDGLIAKDEINANPTTSAPVASVAAQEH